MPTWTCRPTTSAWDILRHVGALLMGPEETNPLGDASAEHLYMAGFSQSGIDTATFALAFNERTRMENGDAIYDGYLPAGHSGSLTPVPAGGEALPKFETKKMSDVAVPVIDLETQSDVEGFEAPISPTITYTSVGSGGLRRPTRAGDDQYRLYEVAGAPHAGTIPGCDGGGSTFPTAAFLRAALVRLFEWAEEGEAPPEAPRIDPRVRRRRLGGGGGRARQRPGRSAVPVPRRAAGPLRGPCDTRRAVSARRRATALAVDVLEDLYGDAATYRQRFTEGLDETISAGFLLPRDRADILAAARAQARAAFAVGG